MKELGMVFAARRIISDININADLVIGDINYMALLTFRRHRIPVILFSQHHLVQQSPPSNKILTKYEKRLVNAIVVNNEAALVENFSWFNEIIYPTVTYEFINTSITPLDEIFPNLPENIVYFVAIGDFKKTSNLPVAMRAFDLLLSKMYFEVRLFVISSFSEDNADIADGFEWLSFEHSQLVHKKSVVLIREATMGVKKSLISNCLAVMYPESEVNSYDSLLYCLSVGALTICVDSTCARNVIVHKLTGMLVHCKEDMFIQWLIKILDCPNFVQYMKYVIQIDFENRFSGAAFSERINHIIYHRVVLSNKVPLIESKYSTFSKLDLIWTLLETNKIGRFGTLSIEQLHDKITNILPQESRNSFFNRVNIAEDILLQELYLLYAVLKQQLVIRVDKLITIVKLYAHHKEFSNNFACHLVHIASVIYMPLLSETPPSPVCDIDSLQTEMHSLDTDYAVHNLLVQSFIIMEEVATDFYRVLNRIRVTVKPDINDVFYPSVCVEIDSLPVQDEDIREKIKYYVENIPKK